MLLSVDIDESRDEAGERIETARPRRYVSRVVFHTERNRLWTIAVNGITLRGGEVSISHEYLAQKPYIIHPPCPPQPSHPGRADSAADSSNHQQGRVLEAGQHRHCDGVFLYSFRIVEALDRGEGCWENNEAREEDPGEERGEDVVQGRNLVELEEHLHVPCLDAVLSRRDSRPRGGISATGCGP